MVARPAAAVVTAIGLYQIFSGQFQKTYKPRHYLCCGQAGPLGWTLPAALGVRAADPERALIAAMADPRIRIVSLTVTEGGYYVEPTVFDGVLRAVRAVPGVFDAYRVTQ